MFDTVTIRDGDLVRVDTGYVGKATSAADAARAIGQPADSGAQPPVAGNEKGACDVPPSAATPAAGEREGG